MGGGSLSQGYNVVTVTNSEEEDRGALSLRSMMGGGSLSQGYNVVTVTKYE